MQIKALTFNLHENQTRYGLKIRLFKPNKLHLFFVCIGDDKQLIAHAQNRN